jgi:hypothetical protein
MRALQPSFLRASVLLAPLVGACSSSGWYDHRFDPAPIEAAVSHEGTAGSQVRSLVTVLGIEKGDDKRPDHAVVRVRLENIGSVPATYAAEMASLLSADLKAFGPPETAGNGPFEIAPGAVGQYDIAFATPEGRKPRELDLSGLNFRFTVRFDGKPVTTGMTFRRTDWNYYDPGYSSHVSVGVGWYHMH